MVLSVSNYALTLTELVGKSYEEGPNLTIPAEASTSIIILFAVVVGAVVIMWLCEKISKRRDIGDSDVQVDVQVDAQVEEVLIEEDPAKSTHSI